MGIATAVILVLLVLLPAVVVLSLFVWRQEKTDRTTELCRRDSAFVGARGLDAE